jgi:PKHD-type hydroxylase
MFLVISEILTGEELDALRQHIAALEDAFQSGAATAGGHARRVKNNEQATRDAALPILRKVEQVLTGHPIFKSAARPKTIIRTLLSRYRPGMTYGLHVDEPMMAGLRTDLSFTLFLSEPSSYDGGALVIDDNSGSHDYKLPAGSLILYPTTTLHRVNTVTSGERLAVVGWVRSYLRHAEQREMLFDLDNVIATQRDAAREVLDQLYKIRANLLRMWMDD